MTLIIRYPLLDSARDTDKEFIYFIGLETLSSTFYKLSKEFNIPYE